MINIYHANCMDIMLNMESGSIDCVITDPPYGMAFQSNRAKDGPRHEKIKNDDILFTDWVPEAYRLLKDGGGIISFCNWETSNQWRTVLEDAGFEIKSQVIWNRMHHSMGDLKGAFAPMHDIIWYGCKGRRIFANGRPKSVLSHQRPSPTEDHGHPTCKPVSLMEELILAIDDGSDGIILDPFLGSGSTGVAAKNLSRKFIGIELDQTYYQTSKNRIGEDTELGWE